MSGDFAAFLRESIKRVTISGMILPGEALADNADGLDTIRKTHIATPLWVRSHSVRFGSSVIVGAATYPAGRCLIETYV